MAAQPPLITGRRVLPLGRVAVAAAVWLVLTDGAADSLLIGVPVVAASVAVSLRMLPPLRLSPAGMIRFAAFFLYESLRGGIDVARRAFDPRLPLAPGIVEYRLRLPTETARVFVTNTISLLPGTLGADLEQERLYVHVLDVEQDVHKGLALAERQVAGLFGIELRDPDPMSRR